MQNKMNSKLLDELSRLFDIEAKYKQPEEYRRLTNIAIALKIKAKTTYLFEKKCMIFNKLPRNIKESNPCILHKNHHGPHMNQYYFKWVNSSLH